MKHAKRKHRAPTTPEGRRATGYKTPSEVQAVFGAIVEALCRAHMARTKWRARAVEAEAVAERLKADCLRGQETLDRWNRRAEVLDRRREREREALRFYADRDHWRQRTEVSREDPGSYEPYGEFCVLDLCVSEPGGPPMHGWQLAESALAPDAADAGAEDAQEGGMDGDAH